MPRHTMSILGILLLALAAVSFSRVGYAADWVAVTGDGKFAVQMPVTPKQSSEDIDTESGRVSLHTYSAASDDEEALYSLSYSDFAAGALGKKTPRQFLQDAEDGSIRQARMTLRGSQEITLGRWPGRAYVAENATLLYTAHIYLVGNRFYQVVRISPKSAATGPAVTKFFESFTVAGE